MTLTKTGLKGMKSVLALSIGLAAYCAGFSGAAAQEETSLIESALNHPSSKQSVNSKQSADSKQSTGSKQNADSKQSAGSKQNADSKKKASSYQDSSMNLSPAGSAENAARNRIKTQRDSAIKKKLSSDKPSVKEIKKAIADEQPVIQESSPSQASEQGKPEHERKPVVKLVKPHKEAQVAAHKSAYPDGHKPIVKLVKPAPPAAATAGKETTAKNQDGHSKVVFVPVQAPAGFEENIPEPKEIMQPPIHSNIPYHQPRVPLFNFRVGDEKTDKSFTIDQTYRGKPSLPVVPTVTFGTPTWLPSKNKRQIATGVAGAAAPLPASIPPQTGSARAPVGSSSAATQGTAQGIPHSTTSGTTGQGGTVQAPGEASPNQVPQLYDVNVRIMTNYSFTKKDTVWAYPYPPRPPKNIIPNPLPEDDRLKPMLLTTGYSARPDLTRAYPTNGWRWNILLNNAMKKAHTGYPHSMFTMYQWVDKMFPYVRAECTEMNLIEERRSEHYQHYFRDYQRLHVDIESQATARGLLPVELKVDARGIAQGKLPAGNWWVTGTRSYPGLKFYWLVPISCVTEKSINLQLNEANALIIGGAW